MGTVKSCAGSKRTQCVRAGYYSRMAILRQLLDQFLTAKQGTGPGPPKQVLSLGAGFDTTWFTMQVCVPQASLLCLVGPATTQQHISSDQQTSADPTVMCVLMLMGWRMHECCSCCCASAIAEAHRIGMQSRGDAPARYFEVDFAEVTAKKAAVMHGASEIAGLLPPDAVVEPGERNGAHIADRVRDTVPATGRQR